MSLSSMRNANSIIHVRNYNQSVDYPDMCCIRSVYKNKEALVHGLAARKNAKRSLTARQPLVKYSYTAHQTVVMILDRSRTWGWLHSFFREDVEDRSQHCLFFIIGSITIFDSISSPKIEEGGNSSFLKAQARKLLGSVFVFRIPRTENWSVLLSSGSNIEERFLSLGRRACCFRRAPIIEDNH